MKFAFIGTHGVGKTTLCFELAALLNGLPIGQALEVVLRTTGHDFTRYKRSTVLRRFQRRMAAHAVVRYAVQYAEQFDLQRLRQFSNFIQENSSSVS